MKKISLFFGVLFIITTLVLSGCTQGTNDSQETISATGVGETDILPDEVSIYLAVETIGESAEESEQENARTSDQVRAELFTIGISASELQTSNFNVYPEYDYTRESRKLIGYRTTNSLVVKTTQFSKIGEIIDACVKGGANRIDSIQFGLSEGRQSEAKIDALEKASKDAKEKAEAIASGLGVKLGKIVSVTSQDYYYNPRIAYASEDGVKIEEAIAMTDTMIIPEELETSARVQVVFKIG